MRGSSISREDWHSISVLLLEFPAGTPPFNGDMAAELMRLHDVALIRVLDLVVILKDVDGGVRGYEVAGLDGPDLRRLGSTLLRVLAADDVSRLAEGLEPGTTAGVVVFDNTWAVPLAAAVGWSVAEPQERSSSEVEAGAPWDRTAWQPLSAARNRSGVLRDLVAGAGDGGSGGGAPAASRPAQPARRRASGS